MSLLKYKYYDSPDGQDIYKKLFVTSKYAVATGALAGTMDVMMFSHPVGLFRTGARYMFYFGPLIGMATAFTVTSNVGIKLRGKQDKLSYFLGGAAAGGIMSAWAKSYSAAVPAMIFFGIAASLKKMSIDEGWVFFPEFSQMTKQVNSVNNDFTIIKDIPEMRNWVSGSNQA